MAASLIRELFRKLFLIYWTLVASQVLGICLCYFLISSGSFEVLPEIHGVFQFFVPIYVIVLAWMGGFFYLRLIRAAKKLPDLALKLMDYRRAYVLKISLLEGANLFVILIFLLTGLNYYFYIFIGVLIIFLLNRPMQAQLRIVLELTEEEEELLRKG